MIDSLNISPLARLFPKGRNELTYKNADLCLRPKQRTLQSTESPRWCNTLLNSWSYGINWLFYRTPLVLLIANIGPDEYAWITDGTNAKSDAVPYLDGSILYCRHIQAAQHQGLLWLIHEQGELCFYSANRLAHTCPGDMPLGCYFKSQGVLKTNICNICSENRF